MWDDSRIIPWDSGKFETMGLKNVHSHSTAVLRKDRRIERERCHQKLIYWGGGCMCHMRLFLPLRIGTCGLAYEHNISYPIIVQEARVLLVDGGVTSWRGLKAAQRWIFQSRKKSEIGKRGECVVVRTW